MTDTGYLYEYFLVNSPKSEDDTTAQTDSNHDEEDE